MSNLREKTYDGKGDVVDVVIVFAVVIVIIIAFKCGGEIIVPLWEALRGR